MEINKNNARRKPRFKNIIHLWEFLLELLANENFCAIISWSRREKNEFKLKKPGEVARRWGILRQKKHSCENSFVLKHECEAKDVPSIAIQI